MKTFDYQRAWNEVARPGYEGLFANLRELHERVKVEAADLSQLPTLDVPWPDAPFSPDVYPLRQAFAVVPAYDLARAARIIYWHGHWAYGPHSDRTGSYWKFSNYADQSLAERLGIFNRANPPHRGRCVRCHEGLLRVNVATSWSWMWEEVGLATLETREAISAAAWPVMPVGTRDEWDDWSEETMAVVRSLREKCFPSDGVWALVRDHGLYMVEEIR